MTGPYLVCAASNAEFEIPGSARAKCVTCGGDVMVAPSGMRFLREHPDAMVLCVPCVPAESRRKVEVATDLRTILEELSHGRPNPRATGRN